VTATIGYLEHMEQQTTLGISVISQTELMVGCRDKREWRLLDRFLRRFRIVTLNEAIADAGVSLLRQYWLSYGLLIADALIAATALTAASPLVTKSQRDYRFREGLELLPYPQAFA
jgi:predicted nucleic acid-binding protein